jgi:uncharacterized NAD(P)/FAD-binding protein YdhS
MADIAIVGGGMTGALVAVNLAGDGHHMTIIDPAEEPGRGLAYARSPAHLLINVPAGRMRPFADKPDDFADYAGVGEHEFPPRQVFGCYVAARLAECAHTHVRAHATAISRQDGRLAVLLDTARTILADAVVLALGNPPPRPLRSLFPSIDGPVIDNPADHAALQTIAPDTPILIVGTGLTMADVVAGLRAQHHTAPITAVSRRGFVPHVAGRPPEARAGVFDQPPMTASALVQRVRAEAARAELEVGDWRRTVDEVRLALPAIWQRLPPAERDRLERHAAPIWNMHRYRMPPAVYHTVRTAIEDGGLRILAGRIRQYDNNNVVIDAREGRVVRPAGIVINCTGPDYAFRGHANPLVESLFANHLAERGSRDNGLVLDQDDKLKPPVGHLPARIYAAGPTARSRYGELTAASEVGKQAARVAESVKEALLYRVGDAPSAR